MKILLIRHASKMLNDTHKDEETPLSDQGKVESWQRGDLLARMNMRPTLYLTSSHKHALQMGVLLTAQLDGNTKRPVINLPALTPHSETETWEELIDETVARGIDLRDHDVVALIGHEPRLSRLFLRLTGKRTRPFGRGEVVCLAGANLNAFWQSGSEVAFRLPVTDFQEEQLRSKIESKMAVSTFLAGFAFTVLVELLTSAPSQPGQSSWWQSAALIALTAAVALFIAAVYMYDRLAMPEGFWVFGRRSNERWGKRVARISDRIERRNWWGKQFAKDRDEHGLLYAYMVWTWKYVFTPAVLFALLGFLAIVANTRDPIVIGGGLLMVVLALIYYWLTRPRLGTD
jgi:phosphohistidine phosphatase SixA